MNFQRKRLYLGVAVLAVLLLAGSLLWSPTSITTATNPVIAMATEEEKVTVPDAHTFSIHSGVYLTKPDEPSETTIYHGDIFTPFDDPSFVFVRKIMIDNYWMDIPDGSEYDQYFWKQDAVGGLSVTWYLREDAPTAVYGIGYLYVDAATGVLVDDPNNIFRVVYTKYWTYVNVENIEGKTTIENFYGGRNLSLNLWVDYNDGATVPHKLSCMHFDETGVEYGAIRKEEVVNNSKDFFQISMQTLSGKVYAPDKIIYKFSDNRLTIWFNEKLGDEVYILKLSSPSSEIVYGQFVINNKGKGWDVNLSGLWVTLMAFGGILVFGSVVAFFAPLVVAKLNKDRVYRETMKVARQKNPEAYAKESSLVDRIRNKLKKLGKKGAAEPVAEEEKPQVEDEAPRPSRFTERIRESREKRQFMTKYGVSGQEADKIKKQNEDSQDVRKNSFAALRDEDDEIASLHEEKVEEETIATGAYTKDGVTFNKLDSMKDDDE